MEKKIPEGTFFEGFYIWFDQNEKIEYYSTSLYLYKTIRTTLENDAMIIKYNLKEKKNTKKYNNPIDNKIIRHPAAISAPYQEQLGTFLINFLNADFSSPDLAYQTFFFAYGFDLLKGDEKDCFNNTYNTKEEFLKSWSDYFYEHQDDLQILQEKYQRLVDIIYNLHNVKMMEVGTRKQRFTVLQSICYNGIDKHKENVYKIDGIINKKKTINDEELKNMDFNEVIKLYNKSNNISEVFTSDYISSICECVLEHLVNDEKTAIKTCKHCGRNFIPVSRKDEIYCDLPNIDGSPTCREKGAKQTYKDKVEDDTVLLEYRRSYQKKITAIYRANNDEKLKLQENFKNWKSEARKRIQKYKNRRITRERCL